jgi:hypothetical protein
MKRKTGRRGAFAATSRLDWGIGLAELARMCYIHLAGKELLGDEGLALKHGQLAIIYPAFSPIERNQTIQAEE